MKDSDEPKIIQIMPAVGWQAIFLQENGSYIASDIVAWALVEEADGSREIVAMDTDSQGVMDIATDTSNFVCLKSPSQDLAYVQGCVAEANQKRNGAPVFEAQTFEN